ncbi:hypothetical protein SMACR_05145 [Sordaria macrospora]|nr:hypothetical protein SMACR_05145 [Sordaria macrospora]WPJ61037.1 hypothetical protein SMAC4_05145 [Sordaria macrospora]
MPKCPGVRSPRRLEQTPSSLPRLPLPLPSVRARPTAPAPAPAAATAPATTATTATTTAALAAATPALPPKGGSCLPLPPALASPPLLPPPTRRRARTRTRRKRTTKKKMTTTKMTTLLPAPAPVLVPDPARRPLAPLAPPALLPALLPAPPPLPSPPALAREGCPTSPFFWSELDGGWGAHDDDYLFIGRSWAVRALLLSEVLVLGCGFWVGG